MSISISEKSSESNKSDEKSEEKNKDGIPIKIIETTTKYFKIDDLIQKKNQEIKTLRDEKNSCEQTILDYLESTKKDTIQTASGKLFKNKTETKPPLTNDYIKKYISDKLEDKTVIEDIMKNMDENRPIRTNINLKRDKLNKKNSNKKNNNLNKKNKKLD